MDNKKIALRECALILKHANNRQSELRGESTLSIHETHTFSSVRCNNASQIESIAFAGSLREVFGKLAFLAVKFLRIRRLIPLDG